MARIYPLLLFGEVAERRSLEKLQNGSRVLCYAQPQDDGVGDPGFCATHSPRMTDSYPVVLGPAGRPEPGTHFDFRLENKPTQSLEAQNGPRVPRCARPQGDELVKFCAAHSPRMTGLGIPGSSLRSARMMGVRIAGPRIPLVGSRRAT